MLVTPVPRSRIKRALRGLALLIAIQSPHTVAAAPSAEDAGPKNANFELGVVGEPPADWIIPPVPDVLVAISEDADADSPDAGRQCAIMSRDTEPGANPFGNLMQRIDAQPYRGQRVRFRGAVRAEVAGHRNQAQLWLRVDRVTADGARALGAFDNMGDRPITDPQWNNYEIVADVAEDAERITVGMMLLGQGKAWLDSVTLEVVPGDTPLTAKSQGGRTGTPLENIKPGLFEIVGSMRIAPLPQQDGQPDSKPDADAATTAEVTTSSSAVLIPLPLAYRDQVPLGYTLTFDPPSAVEAIDIYEDSPQNFVLKATLALSDETPHVDFKFRSMVLVRPTDFSEVPASVAIPSHWPDAAQPWLKATWCADSDHERIQKLGADIRSETDDVLQIIQRVQQTAGTAFRTATGHVEALTAVEALDKRGSCTSCANLVAALLRASGVPARVVAGYPSWCGPLQTHYIVEAYVPDYGWYPIESTMVQSPWPNTHQVHVAIIPPSHEAKPLAGFRPGIAGGVPYLSLTELTGKPQLFSMGTIEGSAGCDHECRVIKPLNGSPDEWQAALAAASSRWQAWLDSTPQLDAAGALTLQDPSADPTARALSAHLNDLQND